MNHVKKINNQCEQLTITGESINFNMDIFKSYVAPFLVKPSFKIGNQVVMKNVLVRYNLNEHGFKRFCIVDDIVKSQNFKTFYDHLGYTEYNTIALIEGTICICNPYL